MTDKQVVVLLGSTGSVGRNTLDVISRHPDRYDVHALAACQSVDVMFEQCVQFKPRIAILQDADAAESLQLRLRNAELSTEVAQGDAAMAEVAAADHVTTVVAAIVGAAGLTSALAAAHAGKRLLLANKESLVMSGQLLKQAARASGAVILPLDSEHNAVFQCLPSSQSGPTLDGVARILLTASGGPLRNMTLEELRVVTPQRALKHPNWSMGPKISIDSATLMNKGLEVIEASLLFDLSVDRIDVVVHPESIIHSMVCYEDGSYLAQMGQPDMRIPIAHALAWPERIDSGAKPLDFTKVSGLHFEAPDLSRFPCLGYAYDAVSAGGTMPTTLNAANEVAVDAFLSGAVGFLQLSEVVGNTLLQAKISPADDLGTIIEADREARDIAHSLVESAARSSVSINHDVSRHSTSTPTS